MGLGAAGAHGFPSVSLSGSLSVYLSVSIRCSPLFGIAVALSWRADRCASRRRCAERTEERLSRHGLNRASVPTACSRAVNFELVRDAMAYVCPECGTKCARSHIRERNRPALSSRSSSLRPRVPASSRSRAYTTSREYTMLRRSLLHSLERVTKLSHACPAFDI